MTTLALTPDTPGFHVSLRSWPVNRRRRVDDEALHFRRLVATARENPVATRVPTLDWPADLFAEVRPEIAE